MSSVGNKTIEASSRVAHTNSWCNHSSPHISTQQREAKASGPCASLHYQQNTHWACSGKHQSLISKLATTINLIIVDLSPPWSGTSRGRKLGLTGDLCSNCCMRWYKHCRLIVIAGFLAQVPTPSIKDWTETICHMILDKQPWVITFHHL